MAMDAVVYLRDKAITLVLAKEGYQTYDIDWGDDERIESVLSELAGHAQVGLIIDFIDETLHFEWVPKLLPWEKPGLEQRLRNKAKGEGGLYVHFSWLPITRTQPQGQTQQLTMLASILQSPTLVRFFNQLQQKQVPVTHVYSFAFLIESMFCHRLAKRMRLGRKQLKQPFMLVFRESLHRFRQIFFHQGHLRIARQVDIDPTIQSESDINQALIEETRRAIKYVYNQKLIELNSEVSFVYINVAHHDEQEILALYRQQAMLSNWNPKTVFVKGGELFSLLKSSIQFDAHYSATPLLAEYASQTRPKTFYQNPYVQTIRRFWLGRKATVGLAWTGLVALMALGIKSGVDVWQVKTQQSILTQNIAQLKQQRADLAQALDLDYDAKVIQAAVTFAGTVVDQRQRVGFEQLWSQVGGVLQQHPHVLIQRFDWQKPFPFVPDRLSFELAGWVYPFEQSFSPPMAWFDQFRKALLALPMVQSVEVKQSPLDASLSNQLSINQASLHRQSALPFTLDVQWQADEGAQ